MWPYYDIVVIGYFFHKIFYGNIIINIIIYNVTKKNILFY